MRSLEQLVLVMSSPDAVWQLFVRVKSRWIVDKDPITSSILQNDLNLATNPSKLLSYCVKKILSKMKSPDDGHDITSQPPATEEPQQTYSPDPIEPILEIEEMLVARLTQGLDHCDWHQLQEKYTDAMDEHSRVEEDLRAQTTELLDVRTLCICGTIPKLIT